jgi:hypothetical protein
MKKYVGLCIAVFSLLFVLRMGTFILTQDVGTEHDSGWYVGVAKNMAEKGIYASYTNTIDGSEKTGGHPSIHGRFSVQDSRGFIYFPAGVTVGPTYILPEALLLRVFGTGWVQVRLWPFICFAVLVPILVYLSYALGGVMGMCMFCILLWAYPQLLLNQSYESLSEHIGLLLLLCGYLLFTRFSQASNKRRSALVGLCVGLAVQAKNIYILGLFPLLFVAWLTIPRTKRVGAIGIIILFSLIPSLMFELYRFLFITTHFSLHAYWLNTVDNKRTWESGGSGISILRSGINLRFVYNKLAVWRHIGLSPYLVVWPVLFISPFIQKRQTALFTLLLLLSFTFFSWFAIFSPTGWFRHIFPGVIVGLILFTSTCSEIIRSNIQAAHTVSLFVLSLLVVKLFTGAVLNPLAIPSFYITTKKVEFIRTLPSPNKIQGPIALPIFSKQKEMEVARFIYSIPPAVRVCYSDVMLVAEIPYLVDRVFFPTKRCRSGDVVIFGPYQKNLNIRDSRYLPDTRKRLCSLSLFDNGWYELCRLR